MAATDHFAFIAASYAAAIAVVVVLTAWVMLDYRAQRRNLAELEKKGVARRSGAVRPERTMEDA